MANPSIVLSNPQEQCLTFFWNELPQYYIGYRFLEGQPAITEQPIASYEKQPVAGSMDPPQVTVPAAEQLLHSNWNKDWLIRYIEQDSRAPVQFSFHLSEEGIAYIQCVENHSKQLELSLQPCAHGVRIWAKLTTAEAIEGSYCLQQCLRFTGMFNARWRQMIAHTPFLSEFDMQAMGNPNGTFTYARRDNQWFNFPVQHVAYPAYDLDSSSSRPDEEPLDHGLIVRETPNRRYAPASYWQRVAPGTTWKQVTSGMYWERTAYISNRHPADCVHAAIDFGPLAAGESRTLRGVVYYLEGSKDDLLAIWRDEFHRVS